MSTLTFTRTDTSVLGRWWWTVDRWLLAATVLLVVIGIILNMAAGPAAAERIGADPFHFVRRQMVFLPLAAMVLFGVSLLPPLWVRRIAVVGFIATIVMLVATLFGGTEIKGATRWLYIAGVSIQPSEFLKPTFAVMAAWMFAEGRLKKDFPGFRIAIALYVAVVALLLAQPDVGQTVVVTAMWATQFFLAGLSMFWVILVIALGLAGVVGAYFTFSHVQSRVDRFLNPESGDTYQIDTALAAFRDGGLFGRGPGEGRVKAQLPDAHTDFIFAVAGEEFGILLCLLLVGLFAFIVLRGMTRTQHEDNLFVVIATGGLLAQFGLQACINMASSLHMMPTKGMTLPFISYGGSSMLGLALGMGMVLALTRRRAHGGAA
ncbi:putative lipid II flippase FtsW [Novispirillum sp. DQ9]|uniref:putative lipid II flippase FtsW n=1 Tax=Novispirillum sp. DQ9 TaxID=3398612 RepID=UPI003C7D71F4